MASQGIGNRLRWLVITVGVLGAVGVGMGAFTAHGLADVLSKQGMEGELLDKRLGQAEVGVRYHLVHAAVLVGVIAAADRLRPRLLVTAACCFLLGVVLFSGSLYLLVLTNTPVLGAVTPFGGVFLIVGWLVFAFSWRRAL